MSNPRCLWCGSDLERAVAGELPVTYVCVQDDCRAKDLHLPGHLAANPYPAELELWVIEIEFVGPNGDSHEMDATWLGLFVSEELAERMGLDELGPKAQTAFTWEPKPVVLTLQGGES